MAPTTTVTATTGALPPAKYGSAYRIRLKLSVEPPRSSAPKVSSISGQAAHRQQATTQVHGKRSTAPHLDKGSLQVPKRSRIKLHESPSSITSDSHNSPTVLASTSCLTLQAAAKALTFDAPEHNHELKHIHSQCPGDIPTSEKHSTRIAKHSYSDHTATTDVHHERPSKRIKLLSDATSGAAHPRAPECDDEQEDRPSSVAARHNSPPSTATAIPDTTRLWDGLFRLIREELNHRKHQLKHSPSELSQLQIPAEPKSLVIPLHSLNIPPLKDGLPNPKRLVIRYNKHRQPIFHRREKKHHQSSSCTTAIDPVRSDQVMVPWNIVPGCNIKWPISKSLAKIERRVARLEERRRKRGGHPKPKNPKKLGHCYHPSFKPSLATIFEEKGEGEDVGERLRREDCCCHEMSV